MVGDPPALALEQGHVPDDLHHVVEADGLVEVVEGDQDALLLEGAEVVGLDLGDVRGDAGGQYKMGRSFQRDSTDGLPANATEARIEAYKWFQLSAAQGYKNSETAYATLTFKMTHADVAEGNRRVARFVTVKNPG